MELSLETRTKMTSKRTFLFSKKCFSQFWFFLRNKDESVLLGCLMFKQWWFWFEKMLVIVRGYSAFHFWRPWNKIVWLSIWHENWSKNVHENDLFFEQKNFLYHSSNETEIQGRYSSFKHWNTNHLVTKKCW